MSPKRLLPVLLLLIAFVAAHAQSDAESPAQAEANLLPPEEPPLDENIEGSGSEPDLETLPAETETSKPIDLEEIEPSVESAPSASNDTILCPVVCICTTEGDDTGLSANCANKGLQDFPENFDPRITSLNVQNNNLTVIPKTISDLKNLKVLIANDNQIESIAPGSVSELLELKNLNLANNKLVEYPQELRNGFSLKKLDELNLGGNQINEVFSVDNFTFFEALKILTLPDGNEQIVRELCNALNLLENVCIGTCETNKSYCNLSETVEDEYITETTTEKPDEITTTSDSQPENNDDTNIINTRSKFINQESVSTVDTPVENVVNVSAATSNTVHQQEVDKSIVGIIVAGMIVIVAGITIKKNWGSIKKGCGSSPQRPATEINANGVAPEEVPLQEKDKSPV